MPDSGHYDAASTGTGKTHIGIGIARSVIRKGRKARFFNAVDLANKLETALDGGGDDLVVSRTHAAELQRRYHREDLRALHGSLARFG